jgi:hypothetical protein
MIRLPNRRRRAFPRPEAQDVPANAWGSQWKHLRSAPKLMRNAMHDGLRVLRG